MPTHNSIGALSELLSFQCLPDFSPSSACTAAPIEISYHDETFFTAEIEFVDIEVWKTKVDIALTYLFDEEGNLLHNPPAEAEKSLAKVRRAYELLTKADFPFRSDSFILTLTRTLLETRMAFWKLIQVCTD